MAWLVELWSNHMDARVLGFGLLIKEFILTFSKSLKHKHKGNFCCYFSQKMAFKQKDFMIAPMVCDTNTHKALEPRNSYQ